MTHKEYEFSPLFECEPDNTCYIAIVEVEGTHVYSYKLMNSEDGVTNS